MLDALYVSPRDQTKSLSYMVYMVPEQLQMITICKQEEEREQVVSFSEHKNAHRDGQRAFLLGALSPFQADLTRHCAECAWHVGQSGSRVF